MLRRTSTRVKEVVDKMLLPGRASRCPLEQELLGRLPSWYGKGKVPVRFEATRGVDSPVSHHHTRAAAMWYGSTRYRDSSFVALSSLWPFFVGTLHCLLFSICLVDRCPEATFQQLRKVADDLRMKNYCLLSKDYVGIQLSTTSTVLQVINV